MLRYKLNQMNFDNDVVEIPFNDIVLQDYGYSYGNTMMVNFICASVPTVKVGDYLKVVSSIPYLNDIRDEQAVSDEVTFHKIIAVDYYAKSITITASKYKTLNISNCYIKYIEDADGNKDEYWYFDVDGTHLYDSNDTCIFYLTYSDSEYVFITNAEVVDCETFRWKYDSTIENAYNCKQVLFPDWAINTQYGDDRSNYPNGLMQKVKLSRPQARWSYFQSFGSGINIFASVYKVSLNIPIELHSEVRLHSEDNINEYFIEAEKENAINKTTEMEKLRYTPVIKRNNEFVPVMKINFNLHFREHSGDDWTAEQEDNWNFAKYGYNTVNDKYYSYDNTSNQADLLTYADFDNGDVKYQKNVLKKSFIRLMLYDSMNPANQNLLGYSTIFFNVGDMYSKYLKDYNTDAYYTASEEEVSGIRVDREVDPSRLQTVLGHYPSDDEIEEHRISCRFTTEHPFLTTSSSEGFYIYLWADHDNGIVPDNLYMKIDFNHAGYGRTIPFMAPYWDQTIDGKNGFKTNTEIKSDWENGGYGIKKYMRYTYIRLKYMYDKESNQHIYYLSPDHYGELTGNELNINLYEARVSYE